MKSQKMIGYIVNLYEPPIDQNQHAEFFPIAALLRIRALFRQIELAPNFSAGGNATTFLNQQESHCLCWTSCFDIASVGPVDLLVSERHLFIIGGKITFDGFSLPFLP